MSLFATSNATAGRVLSWRWSHEAFCARTLSVRVGAGVALLASLGALALVPVPAHAVGVTPTVTLTGKLIQLADQTGPGLAAVRTADKQLVPVQATAVEGLKSGSTITVNVAVPARVRSAAAANRTLAVRGTNGRVTSTPLDARDLAAASDGTPEPQASALGRATVASAASTGEPLAVSAVVAAADPVGSYSPATRRLFVAVVTPAGWSPANAVTQSQIQAQVASTSSYWSTVTGGGVTLSIAIITAPYTSAYTCSSPWSLWSEATTRTGFASAPNTSLVVELPRGASGCGYGLGTIGAGVNDDGMLYVSDDAFPVLAHELGHNMSLKHADTLQCPSASDSAHNGSTWTGASCQEASYGDGQDVMAASSRTFAPFLSSPQSLRTGIISAGAATVVSAGGTTTLTLNALGSRTGVRVAKVVDPTNDVTYYVEYRVATSPDTANVYGDALGVRVLRINPTTGSTVLLDPTPAGDANGDADAALPTASTFTSYSGAVRVTTVSKTASTATLSITIATSTAPSAPTVVNASAGNAQAVVCWAAPASNGGSAITGYLVTASPGGLTAATTGATTATVTGLTNGTSYTFTVTATNVLGTSPASAASAAVSPMFPSGFTAITPARVLDTRVGIGAPLAKLGSGATLTVTVPGLPVGVTAVALNVTATGPTAGSYLTVYPGGGTRPTASNLNFVTGQTIPNMVLVPVGPGGTVSFYNAAGTVNVIADLVGYFAPGAGEGFLGTSPVRVLDTRVGTGAPLAKLGSGATLTVTVPGLPVGVTAVALNVTATGPTAGSYLTVYPGGGTRPTASNLNFVTGQTIPNMVLVPVGPGGTVSFYNAAGTVNVIADLVGYFAPGAGEGFLGTSPVRVLDTRVGTGAPLAKLGSGATLTVTVPGLPVGVTAVALNVTATGPTAGSYLTVYPGGGTRPTASNLNFVTGQTIPNMVLVPVGPGGTVSFYNAAGTVNVIADLVGYFTP